MTTESNSMPVTIRQAKRAVVIAAAVVVAMFGAAYYVWAQGSDAREYALDSGLFAPLLVIPSLQVTDGQALLFKATNISDTPRGVRLMLYEEQENNPSVFRDFPKVAGGMTVSYVHEPPTGQVALGDMAVQAPRPVRAIFQPLPGDVPGTVRNFVAAVQIVRLRKEGATTQLLEASAIVPAEHCEFEARGFLSHTGGRWHWNCAPQMFPIHPLWNGGISAGRN